MRWGELRHLSSSALAIALLGLLESLAIAKSIAARTRQPLDFNRQCWAEGSEVGGRGEVGVPSASWAARAKSATVA